MSKAYDSIGAEMAAFEEALLGMRQTGERIADITKQMDRDHKPSNDCIDEQVVNLREASGMFKASVVYLCSVLLKVARRPASGV